MAKILCLERYCGNDGLLEAFLACKFILPDKNPRVRPIAPGEITRRTLRDIDTTTFRRNNLEKVGGSQVCVGQCVAC